MADNIFNVTDALSQPSQTGYNSFQDLLARQRAQLEQTRPDVAQQMPTLGANTPGQQIYQAQQQAPADQLAGTVKTIADSIAQAQTPPDAKQGAIAKAQQQSLDMINELLSQRNPMTPKQTYGPDIGGMLGMPANSGGILGLGIQPIDVLAFAIGAGLTSRLPQDQAMAWTMKIAGLPKEFEDSQAKDAMRFIQQLQANVGLQNTTTHMGLLQQEEARAQLKQSAIDQVGALADAKQPIPATLALRAGVPPAMALGMQTGHISVQNTPSGLVGVNTASGVATPILDPSSGKQLQRQVNPNAYNDLRGTVTAPVEQGGQGLTPGTVAFQNAINQGLAAQAGVKAGATAQAQLPAKEQAADFAITRRGEVQRQNMQARYGFMADAPLTVKNAPFVFDSGGNLLPPAQVIGKKPSELPTDTVFLPNPQERGALRSAKSLLDIRNKIAADLPALLPQFSNSPVSDIFNVQGNKLVLKSKEMAGNPKLADMTARVNDFIIEAPIAMGLPGGRESDTVRSQTAKGILGGTVQGMLAGLDANIDSVNSRWKDSVGIDITKPPTAKAAPAGSTGTPPAGAVIRRFNPQTGKFE